MAGSIHGFPPNGHSFVLVVGLCYDILKVVAVSMSVSTVGLCFFFLLRFVFIYVCMCLCVDLWMSEQRCPRSPEVSNLLELELQEGVSLLTLVLGTELRLAEKDC